MPLVELINGKTVEIPLHIYLGSDKQYDLYIEAILSQDIGFYTQDFFHDSSIGTIDEYDEDGFVDDDILLERDDI
jgi:hypothetical protein